MLVAVGCSQNQPTKNNQSHEQQNKKLQPQSPQQIMKTALETWSMKKGNRVVEWVETSDQTYPMYNKKTKQWGYYAITKVFQSSEERYDKETKQVHVKAKEEQASAIDNTSSTINRNTTQTWEQWQDKNKDALYMSYSDFRVKLSDSNFGSEKWVKYTIKEKSLVIPHLDISFLHAIRDSKNQKGLQLSETVDTYKITATPEFYQAIPNFTEKLKEKYWFDFDPDAAAASVSNGNGQISDYENPKTQIKNMEFVAVMDKKTNLFQEVTMSFKMELATTGGKPVINDFKITMKPKQEFNQPFSIPTSVLQQASAPK